MVGIIQENLWGCLSDVRYVKVNKVIAKKAGAAAFALAGKGKSSGSAANPSAEGVSSSSDNTPSAPF